MALYPVSRSVKRVRDARNEKSKTWLSRRWSWVCDRKESSGKNHHPSSLRRALLGLLGLLKRRCRGFTWALNCAGS